MEKKFINTSFLYAILAMIGGVFYREFTKFNQFVDATALGKVHVHLFVLGMIFFLVVALSEKQYKISEDKRINKFFVIYNVGLIGMVIMLLVRGITQVKYTALTTAMNASISGIAGLAHIVMAIGIILFFLILRKAADIK